MRPIDADGLKAALCMFCNAMDSHMLNCKGNCMTHSIIDDVPTIEAEPVRQGYWIKQIPNGLGLSNYFVCSQCAMVTRTRYKTMMCDDAYCKHCGAKMDLKEGAENA